METIACPLEWSDWPEPARRVFQAMRSPAGEEMILEKNIFVERILPSSILRKLSDSEMDAYRAPFLEAGESRRPTLTWPREIPIGGEPADMIAIAQNIAEFMRGSAFPKLFINADPGSILIGRQRDFCRTWPNQEEITVRGSHFIQEDSPAGIGQAIAAFVARL